MITTMDNNNNVQSLLSRKDAAGFLSISLRTLDRMNIPRIKMGHSVRYRLQALNAYLDGCMETCIQKTRIKQQQTCRAALSGRSRKKIDDTADWKASKLALLSTS